MGKTNKFKRNFFLLLWGIMIFTLLGYNIAIRKTVKEYKVFQEYRAQLAILDNAPIKISIIENKLKDIEEVIGKSVQQPLNSQTLFLAYVNKISLSSGVRISEMPELSSLNMNGLTIYSQQIVFQGPFSGLLFLLRSIEKEKGIGSIANVTFYTQKERKTGNEYLKMKIIIQTITQENE